MTATDIEEFRSAGHRAVDAIAEMLARLPREPVFRPYPAERAAALAAEPPPRQGRPVAAVLDEVLAQVVPYPFGNGHPRFWGWVNSPPTPVGILAEAIAAAMNPSCAGGNHAAIHVERQAVDWLRQVVGMPAGTAGLLVSGGSMATLTALAVARHAASAGAVRSAGVRGLASRLAVYMTEETHGCARKAVELLGLGSESIRAVPVDGRRRMRPDRLADLLEADRRGGEAPMAVVATAGTVNTGAIDPLDEIADVCRRHGVWMHVDGAYGAPAILSERYRTALAPMARADSVAVDPHKWLYVPVEAGLVLVRDARAMRDAFSLVPPYLRTAGDPAGVGGPPWFSEFGFQQTRGFRALKVWMALRHHGLDGYRALVERDLGHAERLAGRCREAPDLELAGEPSLGSVCFRYAPRGRGDLDALNRRLVEELQLGGRVFVSSTVLGGAFFLRAGFVNPRTEPGDVDLLVEAVRETGARLAGP